MAAAAQLDTALPRSWHIFAIRITLAFILSCTIIIMSFDASRHFGDFNMKPNATVPRLLSPWTALDKAWVVFRGEHADEFRFVQGKTPFSTLSVTLATCLVYLVIVFGGREVMRDRKPLKLDFLFKAHNLMLTVVSGGLLVLFIEQLVPTILGHGLYNNICGADGWTKPLVTLYFLNYITKYIELLDTVFLMLKKKPLTFLHCYHHPATVLLCYTQLVGHTSVSWVPITLNLTVHVVMYWYYFQSARGIKVWWKEWITRLQIAQFVIDLAFIYFASWDYFASTYAPFLPHVGRCAGEPFAAVAGCVILSSYLVLFISFYFATYKKAGSRKNLMPVMAEKMHPKAIAEGNLARPGQ